MKIAIRQDPRFKHRLSLAFGVIELTNEEYMERTRNLARNFGLFAGTSAIAFFLSSLLKFK